VSIANDAAPLPEVLAKPASEHVNAWVCEGVRCLAPVSDFGQLARLVSNARESV
jgi:hypothetical protein